MDILVLCDDYWHPGQVVREGLAGMVEEHSFTIIEDAADWSPERMADFPVTLLAKSNDRTRGQREPWMTDEAQEAFRAYVRAGGGLLVVHSGTASYGDALVLRGLIGGVFDHHPEQCEVTVAPTPGHTLAEGLPSFQARDEHYFMTVDDPAVDVFLTSTSQHGSQPAGWTRFDGAGRVCVITPGHTPEMWQQPGFQAALRGAIRWCAND